MMDYCLSTCVLSVIFIFSCNFITITAIRKCHCAIGTESCGGVWEKECSTGLCVYETSENGHTRTSCREANNVPVACRRLGHNGTANNHECVCDWDFCNGPKQECNCDTFNSTLASKPSPTSPPTSRSTTNHKKLFGIGIKTGCESFVILAYLVVKYFFD